MVMPTLFGQYEVNLRAGIQRFAPAGGKEAGEIGHQSILARTHTFRGEILDTAVSIGTSFTERLPAVTAVLLQ